MRTLLTASTTFVEVVQLLATETTLRGGQLNGPEEVGDFLEVRADSENLVDNVLDTVNAELTKGGLDDFVGAQRHSLAVDLAEATLVDKVANGLQGRITVGDERLDKSKHLDGGSVNANEDTVVDLSQTKKLEDLLHLGGNTDDTANTDNEDQLLLRGDVDLVVGLGISSVVNGILGELKKKLQTQLKKNVFLKKRKT